MRTFFYFLGVALLLGAMFSATIGHYGPAIILTIIGLIMVYVFRPLPKPEIGSGES